MEKVVWRCFMSGTGVVFIGICLAKMDSEQIAEVFKTAIKAGTEIYLAKGRSPHRPSFSDGDTAA